MRVVASADALDDAERDVDWYVEQSAWQAADSFQQELEAAFARLRTNPGLGTPAAEGTRMLPMHRFPYTLVYRASADEVRVIAVAGQRRRPGYWTGRR